MANTWNYLSLQINMPLSTTIVAVCWLQLGSRTKSCIWMSFGDTRGSLLTWYYSNGQDGGGWNSDVCLHWSLTESEKIDFNADKEIRIQFMKNLGFEFFAFSPIPVQNTQQLLNEHTGERILQSWSLSLSLESLCFTTKISYIEFLNGNQKERPLRIWKVCMENFIELITKYRILQLIDIFWLFTIILFSLSGFSQILVNTLMKSSLQYDGECYTQKQGSCSLSVQLFSKIPAKFPA